MSVLLSFMAFTVLTVRLHLNLMKTTVKIKVVQLTKLYMPRCGNCQINRMIKVSGEYSNKHKFVKIKLLGPFTGGWFVAYG